MINGPLPFLPRGAQRTKDSNRIVLSTTTNPSLKMEVVIKIGDVAPVTVQRDGVDQEVAFGRAPYMDWGAGPTKGPAQCDKRIADLANDDEVERLAGLGVTLEMAELWAVYYDFETKKNPVVSGEKGGNPNAPARAKLMHKLAERLRELGRRKRTER